ncbi:MAG: bifunctional phosphopantothenoylcysteine decarboxylase/phosphopantothenate--cysteine ligase CoaBC [Hyphomonas sp.]|uniref:bifunctional phosphopantothenoylcysteine decarboxylase/phosphopantothenate--cysteine ligase CoaBC n=1 Tax=Hyphomonas sp. TaxID=87 RepID=UPI0017BC15BE|nr:bifunctional phosphopantothenoylcysteine decarboxylase/phosphopantothenate--cysteine ligase CoaBC [Hyphomonas sp.]MBU3921875.1 bifunctional phosphopantothenoylcysteine decarboxylase/phosphopantothenate--cysteine ligase CoaBC [Alphaproteobacteria bacterium]MBA3068852.1 bifunctional phosphopantothenoylcysteine decarboxylase/phosphopantothenate--cysteine ligase CoaBC [Hyphomonas sp.]MBU4062937.1 bifunctional phosphopantothenoylcysteine decarboxylase/phosphopantothenate--cysteine ligase CoaBC [Al
MNSPRILLIIGGGIAAYKSLELIRDLGRRGIASRCILTKAGAEFVTPLSVAALSGEKVFTELFDLTDETEMGHIELSRSADLVVVCPATADLMAKAANGLANDLASTTLLATDKPVLMVPAMNVRMWQHAATKRNVARLRADGVRVLEPDVGAMACGEFGPGRLPDVSAIAAEIEAALAPPSKRLAGVHALVTAGPTREPLDPVRYISNHSSGKQGYGIAAALAAEGARVTLVSGPVALPAPMGVDVVAVETARDMLKACEDALPADVFVSVAAVADWRPVKAAPKKLKLKGQGEAPAIQLTENPDILRTISHKRKGRPRLVIGFAAETHDVEQLAVEKRARKGCDWIVANDVSGDVMGGAENEILLITPDGAEHWPRLAKDDVSRRLAARVAEALTDPGSGLRLAAE